MTKTVVVVTTLFSGVTGAIKECVKQDKSCYHFTVTPTTEELESVVKSGKYNYVFLNEGVTFPSLLEKLAISYVMFIPAKNMKRDWAGRIALTQQDHPLMKRIVNDWEDMTDYMSKNGDFCRGVGFFSPEEPFLKDKLWWLETF